MTAIKYSTTSVDNTIKSNNIVIGNNTVDYGPTSTTGFYAGITPPASGYTIYSVNDETRIPTAVVAHNDADAIYFAKSFGGTNIITISDAINYFLTGSTGTTIVNMDYPGIVTSGLTLNLDAGFVQSYPKSGTIWKDLSGNENNGNISGATYNQSDRSLLFDGTSDNFVKINQILTTPITISGFVKYNDQSKTLNTFINSYPHQVLAISINRLGGGELYVYIGNGTGWYATPTILASSGMTINTWYNITFTSNGSTSRIYLNAVDVGGANYAPSGWSDYYYLGRLTLSSPAEYLDGNISNVQIYNRVLSPSEILQNYQAIIDIVTNGLVLYLDAGNQYSYPGNGAIWYDISGNGNNASLVGSPVFSQGSFSLTGTQYAITSTATTLGFDNGLKPFSISLWFKTVSSAECYLFDNWDGTPACDISLRIDNGKIETNITDAVHANGTPQYGSGYNDGIWKNVALTWNGAGTEIIYINGSEIGRNTNVTISGNTDSGSAFYFGSRPSSAAPMSGSISICNVYNRNLSAIEVLQNFNARKSRFGL